MDGGPCIQFVIFRILRRSLRRLVKLQRSFHIARGSLTKSQHKLATSSGGADSRFETRSGPQTCACHVTCFKSRLGDQCGANRVRSSIHWQMSGVFKDATVFAGGEEFCD